jgi:acetyltransferase
LYRYARNIEVLQEIPPKLHRRLEFNRDEARNLVETLVLSGRHEMTRIESKSLLAAYGIPVDPVPPLPHHELQIGAKKDPDFGPVLMFGTGGELSDVFRDHAFALPPINRHLARILIDETKISKHLGGFRKLPAAQIELLEEILMRVSQLVTDIEHIEALDINPLFLGDSWASAVDATVIVTPSTTASPLHLVISPYPNEFENKVYREDFGELLIRPIRPEDATLLLSLYESLSPRSIYMRFFTPLRSFQKSMLVRFTQIDYDREIALVAIQDVDGEEKMLGVSRVILDIRQSYAEFAVIVSDACQGKGIGAELLSQCLAIAKGRGIESVMGVVLAENKQMLALGRKLGFKIARVPGSGEYELRINFQEAEKMTA